MTRIGFKPNGDGTATFCYDNAGGTWTAGSYIIDLNKWHTISFDADLNVGNSSFTIYVDGNNAGTAYMRTAAYSRDYNYLRFETLSSATIGEDFYIDNLEISGVDAPYAITSASHSGGTVTANVQSATARNAKIIFAAFEDNTEGHLLSFEQQDASLSQDSNSISSSSLDTTGASFVRVMLWDDFTNINNLCGARDVSVGE